MAKTKSKVSIPQSPKQGDVVASIDFGSGKGLALAFWYFDGQLEKVCRQDRLSKDNRTQLIYDMQLVRSACQRATITAYEHCLQHRGVYQAHRYGSVEGVVLENAKEIFPIAVMTVKAALKIVGKDKATAGPLAVQELGFGLMTHDEADAVGVGIAAFAKWGIKAHASVE